LPSICLVSNLGFERQIQGTFSQVCLPEKILPHPEFLAAVGMRQ